MRLTEVSDLSPHSNALLSPEIATAGLVSKFDMVSPSSLTS